MKSYILKEAVLKDPARSFFLKNAISEADKRDPLDAELDAQVILKFCQLKLEEAGIKP